MKAYGLLTAVLLAGLLTGLNVLKPVMMDDPAYYALAKQIAQAPGDPYGFEQYWYDRPQPAMQVLAPLAFPYWFALVLHVLGEEPVTWKLALYPFALILTLSLRALFDRFCPRQSVFLLPLTVLSPLVLPSFNLMIDLPVLGLSLASVAIFLRGLDGDRLGYVALAGLVAGVAMQTKYTALVLPAVLLLAAFVRGRLRLGLFAAVAAGAVFLGWEGWLHQRYGVSHFWYHVTKPREAGVVARTHLAVPLLGYLGGLIPAVTLVGLVSLRLWKGAALVAVWILVGHGVLAVLPAEHAVFLRKTSGRELLTWNSLLFGSLGLIALGAGGAVLKVLPWRSPSTRLLAGWLLIEVAGYFALSPFPAARRLQGVIVVCTLLAGRLAALRCRGGVGQRSLAAITGLGVALGLGYFTVDCADAHLEPAAARQAAAHIREADPAATIWFLGTWGFKFHAERLGMQHFVPGQSEPNAGDWLLLVPRDGTPPRFRPPPEHFVWQREVVVQSPVPLHTYSTYYGGHRPLERVWPKKLVIDLYRAARSGTPPAGSLETAATGGRTAAPAEGK